MYIQPEWTEEDPTFTTNKNQNVFFTLFFTIQQFYAESESEVLHLFLVSKDFSRSQMIKLSKFHFLWR